jgi:hypothetical protein
MTLSPRFEKLHLTLTEELGKLPSWKQDALRRDEAFISQRRQELRTPAQDTAAR